MHNTRIVQKETKVVLFIDRREKLPLLSLSFIPAFFSTIALRFVASRRVISCHLHTRYTRWWIEDYLLGKIEQEGTTMTNPLVGRRRKGKTSFRPRYVFCVEKEFPSHAHVSISRRLNVIMAGNDRSPFLQYHVVTQP